MPKVGGYIRFILGSGIWTFETLLELVLRYPGRFGSFRHWNGNGKEIDMEMEVLVREKDGRPLPESSTLPTNISPSLW